MCKDETSNKIQTTGEESRGDSSIVDDSEPLFDRYLTLAQERDRRAVAIWTGAASDILLFSGLFSAVDVALLAVSLPNLKQDPQEKPTFYLDNIHQLLADPNRTLVPIRPTLPSPPTFSPSSSAIWINSLWSLSLVITLSCALLAILVQQWSRQYIKVTQLQPGSSPLKQARIHAIFHEGVEEQGLQSVVDATPILLHASLVLFFAGFVVFSFDAHRTIFAVVMSWVGLCAIIYAHFTLLPILLHESPYYTPLSHSFWLLCTGIASLFIRILRWCASFGCFGWKTWDDLSDLSDYMGRRFSHRIEEGAAESSQRLTSEIDSDILLWALQSSDEDYEVQRFFEKIPTSQVLNEFRTVFKTSNGEKMADTEIGLMDRTLSSNAIPLLTKQRRIEIYNAMLPILHRRILDRVVYKDWGGLLDSVEFGLVLRHARYSDPFAEYYSQCVTRILQTLKRV